jgi:hypothetical protein
MQKSMAIMSRINLRPYVDSNDPQNVPLEFANDSDGDSDPYAALEARESARERANDYKAKKFEP